MRILKNTAAVLAITTALAAAMPADARPGRYGGGHGAYRGGGQGLQGYMYGRPSRYSRQGGYRSYGYAGYGGYSRYTVPSYYGSYYSHNNDGALLVGAGVLGILLGTALSSRSRDYAARRPSGVYYDSGRYGGTNEAVRRPGDVQRSSDIPRQDEAVRYDDTVRSEINRSIEDRSVGDGYQEGASASDSDYDPDGYYRNGGRVDSVADDGAVGM